jgi:PadR family transcriptional regulator PadR
VLRTTQTARRRTVYSHEKHALSCDDSRPTVLGVECADLPLAKTDIGVYHNAMSAAKLRLTQAVMDVLDVLTNTPPDSPAWGLRLCQVTGYGTSTIYPVLDRLLKAGWISDYWEDRPPEDRPRRRFYEITSTGREQYAAGLRSRDERRAAWLRPAGRIGEIS